MSYIDTILIDSRMTSQSHITARIYYLSKCREISREAAILDDVNGP